MIKITKNKDLGKLNTFGMKVKSACYLTYTEPDDLRKIDWDSLPQPLFPMGSGSNLLFTKDFPGTILRSKYRKISILEEQSRGDEVFVEAGAGLEFDDFCQWAASKGYWGIENLSGIPGTVGASAVQNVGAYGVEAGDVISQVNCYEPASGSFACIDAKDCAFAYRDSFFKHNRGKYIVTSVVFRLGTLFSPQLDYGHLQEAVERNMEFVQAQSNPYLPCIEPSYGMPQMQLTPMLVRDTVRIIRDEKLPPVGKVGSAGSFFKNPVVSAETYNKVLSTVCAEKGADAKVPHYELEGGMVKIPAAFLIEYCGFKGASKGGAAVWEKQPLVLVNASGKATADDILCLEREITSIIKQKFGIELSPEVDHI